LAKPEIFGNKLTVPPAGLSHFTGESPIQLRVGENKVSVMGLSVQAQFAAEKYSFGHGTVFPWGGNSIFLALHRHVILAPPPYTF
jgi:hypothetical protein